MKKTEKTDGNSAVEKQIERTEELYKKCVPNARSSDVSLISIRQLASKHSELIDDFKVVTEMNTVAAARFEEVLDKFPRAVEIDTVIRNLDVIYDHEEDILARKLKLLSFKKICVHLDQNTEDIRPKSYAESIETNEFNKDVNEEEEEQTPEE